MRKIYTDGYIERLMEGHMLCEKILRGGMINESQHMVDGIDKIVNGLVNGFRKQIDSLGEGRSNRVVYESNKKLGEIFEGYHIDLTLMLTNSRGYKGGLDIEKSFKLVDGKYVVNPQISVTCYSKDKEDLINVCIYALTHELTHAYNHLMWMREQGRPFTQQDMIDTRYAHYSFGMSANENQIANSQMYNLLGRILYAISRFERNAYIGQFGSEIQTLIEKYPKEELTKLIYQTETWETFRQVGRQINWLNFIEDKETQEDIIRVSNDLTGRKDTTYNQILKYYNGRYQKFMKAVMTRASKIAYSVYEKNE